MFRSLASDPVAPILTQSHLSALDRRLSIVLQQVRECTLRRPYQDVILMHDPVPDAL